MVTPASSAPSAPSGPAADADFFRGLAQHLARDAVGHFQRASPERGGDGARAVEDYVRHEVSAGRLRRNEIQVRGSGFDVSARVGACPHEATCRGNLAVIGEVPQCFRAVTLITAISACVPDRPPMTYELRPGLVDGCADGCQIRLRPAGTPV